MTSYANEIAFSPCPGCCSCTIVDRGFEPIMGQVQRAWTLTGTWSTATGYYQELRGQAGARAEYSLCDVDTLPALFGARVDWLAYVGHVVELTVGDWRVKATINGGAVPGVLYSVTAEFWEAGVLRETKTCSLAGVAAGSPVTSRLCMFMETDGQLMVYLEAGGCNTYLTSSAMPAGGKIGLEVSACDEPTGVGFTRFILTDATEAACQCPQGCANCLYRRTSPCYRLTLAGMEGVWGDPPGCDSCACLNGTFYITGGCGNGSGTIRHWRCHENNLTEVVGGQTIDGIDIGLTWTMSQVAGKYRYQVDIALIGSPAYVVVTRWTFYEDYDQKQRCDQPLVLGLKSTTGSLARCGGSGATVTLVPVTDEPCPSDNADLDHPCHFCASCNDTPDEVLLTASYPGYYTCQSLLSGQYVVTRQHASRGWCTWAWVSENGYYDAKAEITKVGSTVRVTVTVRKIGGDGGTCTITGSVNLPLDYVDCQGTISGQFSSFSGPIGSWSVEPIE